MVLLEDREDGRMFVVTYKDSATGLYNAEPFYDEESAQGSKEAHERFADRYKEITIRNMTKDQFDELESEDFYDEFVTKGTIPGIEMSGEEEEEMDLKEAFDSMAKADEKMGPVTDTEVFVDGDIVKDDIPSGPEEGVDTTIADMLIKAVNDEWETIANYNGLISALQQANMEDFIPVIEDINNEEHKHIGQLQECLKKISPNTNSIESGEEEGAEQLKENLQMPKLKLNESMEEIDELVDDKDLCAHADIPLRIATDYLFRKKLQKQHEEMFKDKEKKLAEFIKKQDELGPKTPKLELKESLFEAADVTDTVTIDMREPGFITKKHELQDKGYTVLWSGNGKICMAKAKAITEAYKKLTRKKSLKESRSLKESSGADVFQELVDRVESIIDDGEEDVDEAVRQALDDGLIYTSDIVALGIKYGAIDDSEVINNMYEELFSDLLKEAQDYYDEKHEEEENEDEVEESFRGVKPSKRLRESEDQIVFTQVPDEEVYIDFEDYVGDVALEGVAIAGNRNLKEFGNEKLIEIVKGEYEGDENWNEEEEYYEDYDVLEMLKKITGKEYTEKTMRGYSQSDWQNIYYPKGKEETARFIEDMYMGKFDEFDSDEEGTVIVPHDVSWDGKEAIRDYIAREIGERPENIKVRMFKGYSRSANYDESLKESIRRKRKLKEAKTTTDKFSAVYDELVREDKFGTAKFRRLKTPNSERYDYEDVSYADGGISVYADTEEGLDFAKEVAKEWNCKTSDIKEHTSRYSKHPYEIVIYVDENEKVSK